MHVHANMSENKVQILRLNVIVLFVLCIYLVRFSDCQKSTKCSTKESCGECIQELGCVWCNNPFSLSYSQKRCASLDESRAPKWCAPSSIVNPQSSITVIRYDPIITTGNKPVQISPQRVQVKLRKGEEIRLNFKYAQAHDYPVDLYYIMDLSASMDRHRKKLSDLGTLLAQTMKALTRNFRLGFGSFVDKVDMPFVSTIPSKLAMPCKLNDGRVCAPPYTFKNNLPLTENTDTFAKSVASAPVSGNLDSPEGGLDALMQAMVCSNEIGWRPNARHLLIFSTDADFHIAGDGKLAGVVEPHDGLCHMENNSYTHGLLLDYPSIGQINRKAIENNMNIIFAVDAKKENIYKLLKESIQESAFGLLKEDSSNVVSLVKNVYSKIVDSVTLTDDSDTTIEVKYNSSCNGANEETKICKALKIGVEVDFTATIKLLECPRLTNGGSNLRTFQIRPGALNESLVVEVEVLCDCPCENPGNQGYQPNSESCSRSGDLKCGVCDCRAGKFGSVCECDGQNSTVTEDTSKCKFDEASEVCSGLGVCKCNKCDCMKRSKEEELIYGSYCECNNFSCKRIKGKLCSGSTNGYCDCGRCRCYAGFGGDACECPDNNSTCIDSANGNSDICYGKGECKCGNCECQLIDGYRYSGKYCEECPSCRGHRCDEYADCVACLAYETGKYDQQTCVQRCTKFKVDKIDKIDQNVPSESNEKVCVIPEDSKCTFVFKYSYDESNNLNVFAQNEKICKTEVNIMAVVLSVIGSILLAGIILLLLWKGFTVAHDRREYAKFENERKNARWNRGENPLFKNPTSTFQNPTFSNN